MSKFRELRANIYLDKFYFLFTIIHWKTCPNSNSQHLYHTFCSIYNLWRLRGQQFPTFCALLAHILLFLLALYYNLTTLYSRLVDLLFGPVVHFSMFFISSLYYHTEVKHSKNGVFQCQKSLLGLQKQPNLRQIG